jgi:methylmalonyl-CoA decarboxylase subunit alpha
MGIGDSEELRRLAEREARAAEGGGEHLQQRQRRLGRLLARERVEALLDPGTLCELGAFVRADERRGRAPATEAPGDGVVCGLGRLEGRPVAVYAHDATVLRGALGVEGARKILRVLDLALEQGIPVVALHDSDGVRVGEGPRALALFADLLGRTARLSGWVPQIGVVLGLCVGGAAYSSALQDIVVGHEGQGFLFVTGAKVTRVVTGQDDPIEELGGVPMHATTTGLVHLRAADERACLDLAARALSYLPQNAECEPPFLDTGDPPDRETPELLSLLPESDRRGYEVRALVESVFDRGTYLELQADWAGSLVVGFARLGGRALGVVASQPSVGAGCLDVCSSRKGARFIQLCNAFGLPVVTLADVPGFLPGRDQERGGLLLHGAKLIAAYAACTVPLVSLILRKSYGGGNVLAWPGDVRLAYPLARVQPMGAEAALAVASHGTFGEVPPEELGAFRATFERTYDAPLVAAEDGFVDRVIRPERTRPELIRALDALSSRPLRRDLPPRRLANIPL